MGKVIDEFYPHAFAESLEELQESGRDGITELDSVTLSTLIDLLRKLPPRISVTEEGWNPCK